jgi:hypothetical protein
MVVDLRAYLSRSFRGLVGDHCSGLVGPRLLTDLAQCYLRRTDRYSVPPERDR